MMLASLPASLDATYKRMLRNIDESSVEDAKRILTLLCFAKRPMTLLEVIDGLAVELGDDPRLNLKRRLHDEYDISQICPGFINIWRAYDRYEDAYTVRIAHYSVQEYLESERIRRQDVVMYSMQSATSNLEIAQVCLIYLLDPRLSNGDLTKATLDEFPLAEYAARHWYEHYTDGEQAPFLASHADQYAKQLFEIRLDAFRNWIRIWDPDDMFFPERNFDRKSEDIASPVYYASLLGFNYLLHGLLEMEDEGRIQKALYQKVPSLFKHDLVGAQGGYYGNKLQAASYRGDEKVVELLPSKGADVNAQGGDFGNALQVASYGGHKKVVELLLSKGADVNAQGGDFGDALQAASYGGHQKVVELLLSKGANVNAHGGVCSNALYAASRGGDEKVVKLLLSKGADINTEGGDFGNALQAASYRGNEKVVELLLSKGADINAHCSRHGNALQAASYRGYEKVVKMLLSKGADVNAQGEDFGNALQASSYGGHKKVVELLLGKGAHVNVQGGRYGNALQAASGRGHKKIVELLLSNAATNNA